MCWSYAFPKFKTTCITFWKMILKNLLCVQQPGMMGVRPMGMQPAMGMQQPIGMQPAMGMQQPMMYGMQPVMGNMMSQPRPPAQTNQDPFGALWDSFSNHYSGKCKKIYYRSWSLWVFNRSPWKTKYCGEKVCACYLLVQATVVFDVTIHIMSYYVDKYLFVLHLMTFLNRLFLILGRVVVKWVFVNQK